MVTDCHYNGDRLSSDRHRVAKNRRSDGQKQTFGRGKRTSHGRETDRRRPGRGRYTDRESGVRDAYREVYQTSG